MSTSGTYLISAATHPGRVRPSNEDGCAVDGWTATPVDTSWRGTVPSQGGWALVADGMGGHRAGEVASRMVLAHLRPIMPLLAHRQEIIAALEQANYALYEAMLQDRAMLGMGSTIVGAVLHGPTVTVFNVGDSRAYFLEADDFRQISIDDTLPIPSRASARRSHALTQSLGGSRARQAISPHVTSIGITPGAKLLLCSDGLTDMVPDAELQRILRGDDLQVGMVLVEAALRAGGADNVTAVVIAAPG